MARSQAPPLLHYALAPLYVALATLVHVSPAGPFLHPTGLFVLAVVAAGWFGGPGPGFFAALLATLVVPQLLPVSYPLTAGLRLLPRVRALHDTRPARLLGAPPRAARPSVRDLGGAHPRSRDA